MSEHSLKKRKSSLTFVFLLTGLILLRFPFVLLLPRMPFSEGIGLEIFQTGSYLLIALLILLERDCLADYHIDRFAIVLILIAPAAKLAVLAAFKIKIELDLWLNIAISVGLLTSLLLLRPQLRRFTASQCLRWVVIAIIVGIVLGIVFGFFLKLQSPEYRRYPFVLPMAVRDFFIQLANAATVEEPLFRGFLWGFLAKRRWKGIWILLFQVFLFTLGHFYYLGAYNYSFFIIVPMGALAFGLLAWRSKSIGTSMIAHGLVNSLGAITAHLF